MTWKAFCVIFPAIGNSVDNWREIHRIWCLLFPIPPGYAMLIETEFGRNNMAKTTFDPMDRMNDILRALKKGILITSKRDDEVNCMTISWGQIGIEWGRLIFTTYVRTGRYTHDMLADSGEFTVNIPMQENAAKILSYCGTKSRRDTDKVADLGLTLISGDTISAPGIKELPMTLECRIIYSQLQDRSAILPEIIELCYPPGVGSDNTGANGDYHTMFYGEIVRAYIIE